MLTLGVLCGGACIAWIIVENKQASAERDRSSKFLIPSTTIAHCRREYIRASSGTSILHPGNCTCSSSVGWTRRVAPTDKKFQWTPKLYTKLISALVQDRSFLFFFLFGYSKVTVVACRCRRHSPNEYNMCSAVAQLCAAATAAIDACIEKHLPMCQYVAFFLFLFMLCTP